MIKLLNTKNVLLPNSYNFLKMRVIVWWLIVATFSFNHLLNFKPHLPYNITLKFQEQNWFLLLFLLCFLFAVLIYTYSINLILNLILNCDKLNSTRFLMQRSNRKPLHGSIWSIAARLFCRTKIGLKNPVFSCFRMNLSHFCCKNSRY